MLDQSGSPDLHLYTFSILDHQNIMNNTFILKVHRHCIFLFFIFGLYYGFFFFFFSLDKIGTTVMVWEF